MDLSAAEKLYLTAIDSPQLSGLALLRLVACAEDSLAALKHRVRSIRAPFATTARPGTAPALAAAALKRDNKKSSKAGGKRRKKGSKHRKDIEASATFSDYTVMKARQHEELLQQQQHAAHLQTSASASLLFLPDAILEHGMEDNGSDEDDDDDDDDSDEDEATGRNNNKHKRNGRNNPPTLNAEMAMLLRRVMLHERILEAATLRRFALARSIQDVDLSGALPDETVAERKLKLKRRRDRLLAAGAAGALAFVGAGTGDAALELTEAMLQSFVFVEDDWLERALFAGARCEDWATLHDSLL